MLIKAAVYARTELVTIFRDKKAFLLIISFPIVFALLYGLVLGAFGKNESVNAFVYALPSTLTTMAVFTCINGAAGSIARNREGKLFARLMFMDINTMVILFGKIYYFLIITLAQTFLLLMTAVIFFHMDIFLVLPVILITLLFAFFSLVIGVCIANLTDSEDGAEHATVLISFVMLVLGAWFPVSSMPDLAVKIARFNPVYYFVDSLNYIVTGSSIDSIFINIVVLLILSAVMFILSVISFKKGEL